MVFYLVVIILGNWNAIFGNAYIICNCWFPTARSPTNADNHVWGVYMNSVAQEQTRNIKVGGGGGRKNSEF